VRAFGAEAADEQVAAGTPDEDVVAATADENITTESPGEEIEAGARRSRSECRQRCP